mmetsp:Transcript_3883/g.9322  ORF Transcript_3883/g.9322 Transcript_3883/m.9322 type:complete len:216 (-) Transcript_3883:27-674(-)
MRGSSSSRARSSLQKLDGVRLLRKLSSSARSGLERKALSASATTRGDCVISGSRSTLRLGVNGSGSRMLRGNADSTRLRIWMQLGGMMSHRLKWWSHRNSGKSCSSTSSRRNVPRYSSRTVSVSSADRRKGSRNLSTAVSSLCSSGHPLRLWSTSRRGRKQRWLTSSSQANAKPGTRSGCSASSALANAASTCGWLVSSALSGACSSIIMPAMAR